MPRWPKGLKARINKEERKAQRNKDVQRRKADIDKARKRLESLRNQNRKY